MLIEAAEDAEVVLHMPALPARWLHARAWFPCGGCWHVTSGFAVHAAAAGGCKQGRADGARCWDLAPAADRPIGRERR